MVVRAALSAALAQVSAAHRFALATQSLSQGRRFFSAHASGTVQSTVRYCHPPPPGEKLWLKAQDMSSNIKWLDTQVDIQDARPLIGRTSLDAEGFEIHVADSDVTSWDDEAEVKAVFFNEAADLVQRATGSKYSFVFDHTFRRVRSTPGRLPAGKPAQLVHLDYSPASAKKRLADFFGDQASEKAGRFAIINVWKPLVDTVYDSTLGVIDARSVRQEDLSVNSFIYPDRVGENTMIHPSQSRHKWFYVSRQKHNEVYLFKQFDSDFSKAQCCPHSAFNDPNVPKAGTFKPRESVELRVFAFYDLDEQGIREATGAGSSS